MSFKSQAVSGFKWSFIDAFLKYFFTFFVSIVLARLLEPADFGLVAMATIFSSISNTLIDGGFGDSLIRNSDSSDSDYNTVFTFNLIISIFLFILFIIFADLIAKFYNEPRVGIIIRVSSLSLLIGAFSLVQITLIRKHVDFRKLAKITFLNSIISGSLSIILAFSGYGFWAILIPGLVSNFLTAILLNFYSSWTPKLNFSYTIFQSHFKFGYKIMLGSLMYMINQNIYIAFLGRFYSAIDLGYFYRADNIQKLPASNLDNIIRHVTYSLFAKIQQQSEDLIYKYSVILRFTAMLNSFVLLGFAANAYLIILVLFGEKWTPSVEYLQILCFSGVLFPLISININILNVKGRSDLTLKLTIIRFLLSLIVMTFGYYFGIKKMIISLVFSFFLEYIIVAYIISKNVNYPVRKQLKDISKGIFSSVLFFFVIYFLSKLILNNISVFNITIIFFLNVSGFIAINKFFGNNEYKIIENMILRRILKKNKH